MLRVELFLRLRGLDLMIDGVLSHIIQYSVHRTRIVGVVYRTVSGRTFAWCWKQGSVACRPQFVG